ncbi:MAG: DUF5979 domain-containing protein [Chloroflexota bacterium]
MNSPTTSRARHRASTFRRFGWLAVAAMTTLALVGPAAGVASATEPALPSLRICHAKPADTAANGYNEITVDVSSTGYQHSGHQDMHAADIIPPYSYETFVYGGKNWDTAGQAIWNNGCKDPTATFGSLLVTKTLAGNLTGFAGGDFTFSVTCGGFTYDPITINLASDSKSAAPILGIVAGLECTVTETGKADAGIYGSWDSPAAGTATITADTQANVTITNTRTYSPPAPAGSLLVTKALAGNLTGFAGGDFTFSVTCGGEAYGPITITLASGSDSQSAAPITGIPVGAECTVTETGRADVGTDGSWGDFPAAGSATIVAEGPVGVTITNTRTYNPPVVPTCEELGTCPTPTPTPTNPPTNPPTTEPTPTGTVLEATSEPSAEVLGATGRPNITPPPTDTLPTSGTPGGDSWRIALLAIAGLLAMVLLLTPATPARARRRR